MARGAIDLLNPPVAAVGDKGSSCKVCFNYFQAHGSQGKFKYNTVDSLYVSLDSILTSVTMTRAPSEKENEPNYFLLDPSDRARLDEYVAKYNATDAAAQSSMAFRISFDSWKAWELTTWQYASTCRFIAELMDGFSHRGISSDMAANRFF